MVSPPIVLTAQTLRPYQGAAIDNAAALVEGGKRKILVVAPTGAGKTTIASHIIARAVARANHVLFIAHRKELIDQASTRLDGQGVPHGVIMADHPRSFPHLPVQVASIQTLMRRGVRPPASVIFIDEAHRAMADSYDAVLAEYPQAVVIGLTATPWRIDGKGLGDLFESLIVVAKPHELIEQGYLVPVTGFAYDTPDLSGVRSVGADYDPEEAGRVMSGSRVVGNVVEKWREHCAGKRTVLFACTVPHSQTMVEQFRSAGVTAEHVDAKTPKRDREGVLARLARGETTVVCNVGILTEGWDCPSVEVCVLARPTQSLSLYLQMIGRAMRPVCRTCGRDTVWTSDVCVRCGSPDVKRSARLHDHSGNSFAHGLPQTERIYSLTRTRRRYSSEDTVSLRTCQACFAVYPATEPSCPACGFTNPKRERSIKHLSDAVEIRLEELVAKGKEATSAEKMETLRNLVHLALARGAHTSWAYQEFKRVFGHASPWRYRMPYTNRG